MSALNSPDNSSFNVSDPKIFSSQRRSMDNSSILINLNHDMYHSSPSNHSGNSSLIQNDTTPVSTQYNRRNSSPLQAFNSSANYEYFKKTSKSIKSKLDLIDDTQLTSLPLPPPPSANFNSVKSNSNDSLIESELEDDTENDEQIILIEDYIRDDNNLIHKIEKKKSLATFKKKLMISRDSYSSSPAITRTYDMNDQSSVSNISTISTFNSKLSEISEIGESTDYRIVSQRDHVDSNQASNEFSSHQLNFSSINSTSNYNSCNDSSSCSVKSFLTSATITQNSKKDNSTIPTTNYSSNKSTKENLEEIFGKVPGMDKLKYCDLCDKPLYELSSLIDNDKFNEFICSECTETYEGFFNELNNQSTNLEKIDLNREDSELDVELHLKFIKQLQSRKSMESLNLTSEKKRSLVDYQTLDTPSKKKKLNFHNKISFQPDPNSSPKKFSKNLIKKLTNLQQDQFGPMTPPSASTPVYTSPYELKKNIDIKAAELWNVTRKKLRWRWRIRGLLPQIDSNFTGNNVENL